MEKGKKSLTFKTKDFSVLPYSRWTNFAGPNRPVTLL
jgi:hypothetical protein